MEIPVAQLHAGEVNVDVGTFEAQQPVGLGVLVVAAADEPGVVKHMTYVVVQKADEVQVSEAEHQGQGSLARCSSVNSGTGRTTTLKKPESAVSLKVYDLHQPLESPSVRRHCFRPPFAQTVVL